MSAGTWVASVEGSEAAILAGQMRRELLGKKVGGFELRDSGRMQQMGFLNKDARDYEHLTGGTVRAVAARGNTIVLSLDNGCNLVLFPEYGGEVFFWKKDAALPDKYHLRVAFEDGSSLAVRLMGLGGATATPDTALPHHYGYRRDFAPHLLDPMDAVVGGFTFEPFSAALEAANKAMESVLVGKEAVLVGISNSTFQDVLFHAKIHPKRKASSLGADEREALFEAVRLVVSERMRLGGKEQWLDLYGRPGSYVPAMGPGMIGDTCPECGSAVEKIALGGGEVRFCPACQR